MLKNGIPYFGSRDCSFESKSQGFLLFDYIMSTNYLAFSISKATPTTSTNNENSVVTGTSTEADSSTTPTVAPPKAIPFLSGSEISSSSSTVSPKFGPVNSTPVISVSPTLARSDVSVTTGVEDTKGSGKPDLIGLFDKFDINKSEIKLDNVLDSEAKIKDGESSLKEHTSEKEIIDLSEIASESREPVNEKEESNEIEKDNTEEEYDDELEHQRRIEMALGNFSEDPETKTDSRQHEAPHPEMEEAPNSSGSVGFAIGMSAYEPDIDGEELLIGLIPTKVESEAIQSNENLIDIDSPSPAETKIDDVQTEVQEIALENTHTNTVDPPAARVLGEANGNSDSHWSSKVDPVEQHQQSHKPFDFQTFLTHLKKKSADPIVRYIRSFLVSFSRQSHTFTFQQKIKIITDFKAFVNEKFALYEPFASMDDIDLENSREGLEKLIMNRLYDYCFPPAILKSATAANTVNTIDPMIKSDLEEDSLFIKQIEKFSWVNGSHLDISLESFEKLQYSKSSNFIEYAVTELNKINNFRAPRDKIICILNLCKIIIGFLKANMKETNADEFIPLLILVILKAKSINLISDMHYIEHFRAEEWLLHGETSYYLSSIEGAIGFIQNLSKEGLTIENEEYDAHMEAWDAEQAQLERERKEIEEVVAAAKAAEQAENESSTGTGYDHERLAAPVPISRSAPYNSPQEQLSFSPFSSLLSNPGIVGKSIANFLSPSPQPIGEGETDNGTFFGRYTSLQQTSQQQQQQQQQQQHPPLIDLDNDANVQAANNQDPAANKAAFDSLSQMFPNLDKGILQDLVYIKNGNIDECVDVCLELVGDA